MHHLQFSIFSFIKVESFKKSLESNLHTESFGTNALPPPKLLDTAAMSNSTAITLVTHLYQVFPKNPTWFSGKKSFALISSVYRIFKLFLL